MRSTLLLALALACPVLPLAAADPLTTSPAGTAPRALFVRASVSEKQVALNKPVRIEFTTMPAQVEGVDIAASVANSLALGVRDSWRVLGKPTVVQHDKTKTITVSAMLIARTAGDLQPPDVPITWLQGNQIAHFDTVVVSPVLAVGGTTHDLPKVVSEVAGIPWGAKFEDYKARFPKDQVEITAERTLVHPAKTLTLEFDGGRLAQASMQVDMTIDQVRSSTFFEKWGTPHIEDGATMTWILGFTRITAAPTTPVAADAAPVSGVTLSFAREDVLADVHATVVNDKVFGLLDGPAKETPEQVQTRKDREIEQELDRPAVKLPETPAPAGATAPK
jgi:hypothetical protein